MTSETRDKSFLKSVKGKVLFGFLVGVAALAASYVISKGAFDEVEGMVSQLSTPNEKLRLVNVVFQDILLLNQLQNDLPGTLTKGSSRQEIRDRYTEHSERLKARLDTLARWFSDSPRQLERLDTIRFMLDRRADTFGAYVRERRGLATSTDLRRKVDSISEIIATSAESKGDSTVIKTEKQTTTTTTTTLPKSEAPPATGDTESDDGSKRGFLSKLFKSKKPKEEEKSEAETPVVVKKEEIKVSIDTLTIAKNDSAIQIVGKEIKSMAQSQMVRANRFFERERQLQVGETLLIGKLMEVTRDLEADVLENMYRDNGQVKQTIGKSIKNMGIILLAMLSITAFLGSWIFTDITRSNEYRKELILAKEEADYHSEAKQRFLANMSHEIRTPLQSIIGFSELVMNQRNPSRTQLEMIHKSSEHLLHLVNEILDYSRIISDSFEFSEESFEVGQVLEDVVATLRPQAVAKGFELALVNGFDEPTFVSGDAFRLKQILHNLIGNAIKFTKEGQVDVMVGPVVVNGSKEIRLEVRDTGIGMKPEQVKRIFNQFEQGHAGITPEYGGAGLGLSIVKALVTGQGGRINVDSKLGEFSSFTVFLPFREGQPVVKEEALEEMIHADFVFEGKVWIVDDDHYILEWLKTLLEQLDVGVRAFSSPVEADNCSWDPEISVVFIDMRMPQMSGPELCESLRKKAGPSVRFIACTAMALPDERARILGMGFDDVLMKPFRKPDVLRVLGKSSAEHDAAGAPVAFAGEDGETEEYLPESTMIDISNLVSMTMGDEQLLKDSLEQFVEDTLSDLALVEGRMVDAEGSRDSLRELFHRLAGRTGQVGAISLGSRMRQIEIALAGDSPVPTEELEAAVREGYQLVEEIQEKYVS